MNGQRGLYAQYSPPGPKAEAWLHDNSPGAFIIGPVGSAKTTTGAMKCFQVTTRQHPSTIDGVRRALIVAIRMNYRRMHDTLLKSYKKMFLETDAESGIVGDGVYEGVKDGKMDHFIAWRDPKFGRCEMRVLFRAFGETDIEGFIRGFEPTAFWLNEADELPEDCLGLLFQRAGQRAYMHHMPDPDKVPPPDYCRIFGDLNMPDEDSWFYNDLYLPAKEGARPGIKIYEQPSGFDPRAENLHNLRRDNPHYYQNIASRMQPWQVRRFIENKVGLSRHGDPVYPMFSDANTGPTTMAPAPRIKLVIGVDQGLTPAAAITQKDADGRMLILREFVTPANEIYGAEAFGRDLAQILLDEFRAFCGPGGFEFVVDEAAKQRESDERRFAQRFMVGVLSRLSVCPLSLCPSQNPNVLNDAVNHFLRTRPRRGGGEGLYVHPRCTMVRRGGISGYRLRRVKRTDGANVYKQDKNEYSHIWNAVEFAAFRHYGGKMREDEFYGRSAADPNTPKPSAGGLITQGEVIAEEEFV